jgi:energy-coupling factor transporter ATPase
MQAFIDISKVHFSYRQSNQDPLLAVQDVSLQIASGSHVAILGRNGSGKSTLARLINALEQPSKGVVVVSGRNTAQEENVWEIRRLCGMVFQNPDNQIVGTTVEEDVAIGPENLGFPQPDIRRAVDESLAYVGLAGDAQKPPHLLSGGQKQKLAIAGILAMKPACLILDEATSMLDPVSRHDFMQLVQTLVRDQNMTVVNITHHMEEVLLADFVYVMSGGRVVTSGTPAEVFDQVSLVRREGLDVPDHTEITHTVARLLDGSPSPLKRPAGTRRAWPLSGCSMKRTAARLKPAGARAAPHRASGSRTRRKPLSPSTTCPMSTHRARDGNACAGPGQLRCAQGRAARHHRAQRIRQIDPDPAPQRIAART